MRTAIAGVPRSRSPTFNSAIRTSRHPDMETFASRSLAGNRRIFGGTDERCHQVLVMTDRHWPADQIPLNFASLFRQEGELFFGLDAFGNNRQREGTTQSQNGVDDRGGLEIIPDFGDEGLVDLDLVERKGLQVGERRISGSEVVHGDAYAEVLYLAQDGDGAIEILEQYALRDFDLEA